MSIVVNIAIIITPIVIGLGFVFAYKQLRASSRQWEVASRQWQATRAARMAQVILEIAARWDSKDLKESRQKVNENAERLKEAIEQADANNSKDLYDLVEVGNFFDTLGVLVMEGFLSCRIAYDLLGGPEKNYYKVYKAVLEDPKYKNNYKYFIELDKAFENEEAERSKMPHAPRPPV